tara:strand:- start:313 stop:813 length:501 start_codon:yes stop_codon:yes gene_type:complete
MKDYKTFLSEQNQLLTEKGNKSGGSYAGKSSFTGMGLNKHKTSVNTNSMSFNSPMFKHVQNRKTYHNWDSLIKNWPALWSNKISKEEAKQLSSVVNNMPDGESKRAILKNMETVSLMPYSDAQINKFNEIVTTIKNNTFSNEQPTVPYKAYTPYNDVYKRNNQRMF